MKPTKEHEAKAMELAMEAAMNANPHYCSVNKEVCGYVAKGIRDTLNLPALLAAQQRVKELEAKVAFLESKECEAAWCDRWKRLCAERDQLRAQLALAEKCVAALRKFPAAIMTPAQKHWCLVKDWEKFNDEANKALAAYDQFKKGTK